MTSVVVGGTTIAYDTAGTGAPSIVLVAGGGGDRTQFSTIFDAIAQVGTVVSYDGAGCGESGPADIGEDGLGWRVRELHDLLTTLETPCPLVLVGFSIGAMIAELFCIEHPEAVCGLVSIDGDDGIPVDLPPWPEFPPEVERQAEARLHANVPSALLDQWTTSALKGSTAVRAESVDRQRAFDRRSRAHNEGRRPDITFIHVGAVDHFFGPSDLIPIAPEVVRQKVRDKHVRTASRYPRGEYVEASGSSHFVHFDEPELVVEAVRRVVASTG